MIAETMLPISDNGVAENRLVQAPDTINDISEKDDLDFTGMDFLVHPSDNISYTRNDINQGGSNTLQAKAQDLLLHPPKSKGMRERFHALQKWEGYVLDVDDEVFQARLVPLKGEGCEQEAEIFLSEITADDRLMVKPGAVFYWSIGYLEKPSGTIRASIIRFRRLPTWTVQELRGAETRVAELKELLGV